MSGIIEYLNGIYDLTNKSGYRYLLNHGKLLYPANLTPQEKRVLDKAFKSWGMHPIVKQCFYNCQMICMMSKGRLKYWEGFAVTSIGLPVEHAWLTINNKVVDVTWNMLEDPPTPSTKYYGLRINRKFFQKHMVDTGYSDSLLWFFIHHQTHNNRSNKIKELISHDNRTSQ